MPNSQIRNLYEEGGEVDEQIYFLWWFGHAGRMLVEGK